MNLTDEQCEAIDDAIEDALSTHDVWSDGRQCSCGVKDNIDGDVLFGHRVGVEGCVNPQELADAILKRLGIPQGEP